MERTAVVTGAYGYLGSLLRARLDAAGWTTTALVRTPRPGDRAAAWSLGEAPPLDMLRETAAVVHCAYDFRARTREEVWRVNVEGSGALLRSAAHVGVSRMLVLSSMSAYPGTAQIYGQAKLAIEDLAVESGGIAVKPGLVYGDSPGGMAGALLKLTRLPFAPIIGGSARQFPVHEDDLGRVILEILSAPTWTPEVFGIAQREPVSFRELMSALALRTGGTARFVPVPWRAVYYALRFVELTGALLPLRSDSVLGLVRPATFVPPSSAFPSMLETLRSIHQPTRA